MRVVVVGANWTRRRFNWRGTRGQKRRPRDILQVRTNWREEKRRRKSPHTTTIRVHPFPGQTTESQKNPANKYLSSSSSSSSSLGPSSSTQCVFWPLDSGGNWCNQDTAKEEFGAHFLGQSVEFPRKKVTVSRKKKSPFSFGKKEEVEYRKKEE